MLKLKNTWFSLVNRTCHEEGRDGNLHPFCTIWFYKLCMFYFDIKFFKYFKVKGSLSKKDAWM